MKPASEKATVLHTEGSHPGLEALANDMEIHLNTAGHTLTDEDTATVWRLTLDLVDHTLKGATAQDIISEDQRAELAILFAGMRAAPDHL